MLQIFVQRWKRLVLWLLYLLFIFQATRLLMYVYHLDYFKDINSAALLRILLGGCRFDWVIISIGSSLLILTMVLPFSLSRIPRIFKGVLMTTFIILHFFLLLNLVDIPYFSFIHKRSTADLFFQLGGQTDVIKQIPVYLRDYWFLFILFIMIIILNHKIFYGLFQYFLKEREFSFEYRKIAHYIGFVCLIIAMSIVSIRGGLQRIPLDIVDAGFYADPNYTPLVINTPFSILKSLEQQQLITYSFFEDRENIQTLQLIKHYPFREMVHKNIVVIILESFSKEYTKLGGKKSYTPFLDSLMNHCIVFENGWSNGTKSIEGVPAIISSIPSWMNNPYINSLYCNNFTHSLPFLLSKEKYFSAFFHGGINGTMNFDAYAVQAGFHRYYGKNEYNNDADFDGYWGIWDEPFLQYTAKELATFSRPFLACIFTLSSHHPFHVPDKYQQILPHGDLPIQQSIAYSDLALSKFFRIIKTMPWYNQTIFVITADHTGISSDAYYSSIAGRYQIPVLIFDPSQNKNIIYKNIIQQIDILPTLLYMLHYPHPFFAFGNNYFDASVDHSALFYENGYYYLVNDSMIVSTKEFKIEKIWDYRYQQLKEIELDADIKNTIESQVKRIIQAYNNTLVGNKIEYYMQSKNTITNKASDHSGNQ